MLQLMGKNPIIKVRTLEDEAYSLLPLTRLLRQISRLSRHLPGV